MEKPILYVDMDGVTADFYGAVTKLAPPGKTFLANQDSDWVTEVCVKNPNIFRRLEPIPGAIAAINRLSAHYHILFLSAHMCEVPQSLTDKFLWLESYFGTWSHRRLKLTHEKHRAIGHYLIDDRITNGVDKFTGKHIHFGTTEFPDWEAVELYLMQQLQTNKPQTC